MAPLQALCTLVSCMLIYLTYRTDAHPRLVERRHSSMCRPCRGPDCEVLTDEDCKYGAVRDFCGNSVCGLGPGQKCGIENGVSNKCGKGLSCLCGFCNGCSTVKVECFIHPNIGPCYIEQMSYRGIPFAVRQDSNDLTAYQE